jgi:hypothetical protein
MSEGSWVGLDVHARSVVAGVIDQGSGEVRSLRVPAGPDGTVGHAALHMSVALSRLTR